MNRGPSRKEPGTTRPSVGAVSAMTKLQHADSKLFTGSRYATLCGRAQGRQPVVVTRAELTRIDRTNPGSHTGAIVKYGTSPAAAQRNAYLCPTVWCPRDRVAMNRTQLKKAGGKCPNGSAPNVYDTAHFKGKKRHIGFLDSKNHPKGACIPCCFTKPVKPAALAKCPGAAKAKAKKKASVVGKKAAAKKKLSKKAPVR